MTSPEQIDDGGAAFPAQPMVERPRIGDVVHMHPGMSLLDWFAGQALAAMAPRVEKRDDGGFSAYGDSLTTNLLGQHAYIVADAMLKARAE